MLKKYIKNDKLRNVVEWIITIAIAFCAGIFISNYVARTATVFGESMEPTLSHNDIVVIDMLSYRFSDPKQGDIVAFPYKTDPSRHFVKRVIGLPGDIIEFKDDTMYINEEPYSDEFFTDSYTVYGNTSYPLTVPEGQYFVMGDNRSRSEDSRYIEVGCIPKSEMDGKVKIRLYPFNKLGFLR